ncbi:MAG: hypothetical protein U0326_40935 [Polyangiales bacterium]
MKLDDGYQCASEALKARGAQGPFCAYCEGQIRETGNPIEHFRPKAAVYDDKQRVIASGYWWLTWSWENLLRACGTCNDQGHKGNQFPLFDEGARLAPMQTPPGDERPLLIDPTREDPMRFIEFRIQGRDIDGDEQWKPFPRRGLTRDEARRAIRTIEVFGLDRGDILGFYTSRVKGLAGRVESVTAAIARGDALEAAEAWRKLLAIAFGPYEQYKALAYDYIRHAVDDDTRSTWHLTLDTPGAPLGDHASRDPERPVGFDDVSWLEIAALGRSSPDNASIRALLVRVVALGPCTTAQLSEWFHRSENTVKDHLEALATEGKIEHRAPRWHAREPLTRTDDDPARR